MRDLLSKAAKYRAEARRRKLWQRAVSLLACVVLLFTTYAQILPAITLEQTERLLDCHYAVHEHTAACYDGDELICGQADFVVHTHDKNCYDPSGRLVCPLPEIKTHTHTEACYASLPAESEQEQTPADGAARLICGQKEAEGHTHTDECYETEQVLVCGLEATEGHTHTDACYEKQLTCTETETEGHTHDEDCYKTTKTLLCINTDTDHIHSEACYDIEQTLICTEDEVPAHEHDDTCYEEVLICGQEEAAAHEHTEACYEERRTLICEKEETEGHTHSEECYAAADEEQLEPEETPAPSAEDEAQERELICGQEEIVLHTHSKRCYDETGALICGQLEVLEHQHQDGCFQSAGEGGSGTPDQPEKEETPASRLLEAVKGELGYTEDEDGHTLYGEHYARGDEPWNVMFVAYCLEKAEITAMPSAEDVLFDCDLWRAALQAQELYQSALTYTPAPGELVFLDEDGDNIADLVAVVEKVTDERVEVIAGDLSDGVRRADYSLDDDSILGYAQLPEDEENPVEDDDPKQEEGPKDDTGEETPDKDEPADDEKEEEDAPAQGLAGRVLAAAVGQIGYAAAEDGTTLYGEFYDRADAPWNVMFAAYCLEQAGVAELPLAAAADFACDDWLAALTGAELFREGGAYTPAPGDLAFFDLDEDGAADFVAIVEKIAANRLHLIAGDVAAGCVKRSSWALDDAKLVGYVQLAEQADEQETPAEETKLYQTAEDSPVQATVTFAKESKISKDAVLTVSPITETLLLADPEEDGGKASYALLKEQAEQAVGKQAAQFALYDISFYTPDEEYIPVTESATVSLRLEGDAFKAAEQIAVLHYPAGQEEPTVLENVVWETDEDGITTVTFQTDGFSVFGIMALAEDELAAQGENNSFTLTYKGYTITFNLVDAAGNPISGEYTDNNIEAADATRYIFASKDENATENGKFVQNIAPTISGYTYSGATKVTGGSKSWDKGVYSVATHGYTGSYGGTVAGFKFYTSEPIAETQFLSWGYGNYTVTLTYTQNADNLDGLSFVIGNKTSQSNDYALTAMEAVTPDGKPALGSQSTTITQNSDSIYQVVSGVAQTWSRWTFHRQADGAYLISTTVFDGSAQGGDTAYLQLYDPESDTEESLLRLTKDASAASHIKVEILEDGRVTMCAGGCYISFDERNNVFFSYKTNVPADASKHYICEIAAVTSNIITNTVNHPSSVINLFDYWLVLQEDADNQDVYNYLRDPSNLGINRGHALVFSCGDGDGKEWNKWTGTKKGVYQGIVKPTLGEDGYPVLAVGNSEESLNYLFDPNVEDLYKASYPNVSGLLQINSGGYYYYDSSSNFAEYDALGNQFVLYDKPGIEHSTTKGGFFPFNTRAEVDAVDAMQADNAAVNHYFGLTLTTRFAQQYGGHTTASRLDDTIFDFKGDDDVWIFIDNVLVADLGGIHDSAEVKINFDTGEIKIDRIYDSLNDTAKTDQDSTTTTLRERFEAAGKTIHESEWNENTFADNTYHTLKFFYLERGNYASNLYLQYNLAEIPLTAIYKVNQYGEAVQGAKFAVYRADENYNQLSDAVYTGTTDAQGEMIFEDEYGMPYALNELEDLFGKQFILRETEAPANYSIVSNEIHLYIKDGLLSCANVYDSGVWAAPTLQVAAPQTLKYVDERTTSYYSFGTTQTSVTGTLFAVVLRYKGEDESGLLQQVNWEPLYGSAADGYTSQPGSDTDFIQAVIEAAKQASRYGQVCFEPAANGTMQLSMTNLPGDIRTYYYMLDQNNKADTKYTIGYYYTTATSLAEANTHNTERVDADDTTYIFDRVFGATIKVPNLVNRLFAQKLNEKGEPVCNAAFALYQVKEEQDGTIYYIASNGTMIRLEPDEDGDGAGTAEIKGIAGTLYAYKISGDGEISLWNVGDQGEPTTQTGHSILPYENQVQRTMSASAYGNPSKEDGTATFSKIDNGTYYLREIAVPKGYLLNPTEVMVLVADDAVYANAGTANDGVSVARGPGYLVATMNKFASQGAIDNTLSWIYAKMRISGEEASKTFSAYDKNAWEDWDYIEGTTYLEYDPMGNSIFNYAVNPHRVGINTRRLSTETGWTYYELYQDYDYGKDASGTANYTPILENGKPREITNLFSRSTYIRMTDQREPGNLEISKTVVGTRENGSNEGFEFKVTLTPAKLAADEQPETKEYKYKIYKLVTTAGEGGETETKREIVLDENGNEERSLLSGGKIMLKHNQVAVIENIPAETKYTVSEMATGNSSYIVSAVRDAGKDSVGNGTGELQFATVVEGMIYWKLKDNGDLDKTSTVDYTNTYLTSLAIHKVDSSEKFSLAGAQFVLYKKANDDTPRYYTVSSEGETEWEPLGSGETKDKYALTTDEKGMIYLNGIEDAEYYLEEIKAPEGYYPLTETISITIEDGKLEHVTAGQETGISIEGEGLLLKVPNKTGYELPQTGGSGYRSYTLAGGALLTGAVLYGFIRKRKGAKMK